jgi:transposase
MEGHELSDQQWDLVASLFPPHPRKRGGQWKDDRTMLNGIFWRLSTGNPWRALPRRYGPWQTVYHRFSHMRETSLLKRLLDRLRLNVNEAGLLELPQPGIDRAAVQGAHTETGAANQQPGSV